MADEFDATQAATDLTTLVAKSAEDLRATLPPAVPVPLFTTRSDGSVVDSHGQELRGKMPPLELKAK
jgi:hypothetical protein